MILSNQAKCLKCGDEIYSAHRHDFKYCSCENIFVDGGMSYIRHGFEDIDKYLNQSMELDDAVLATCMSALDWCDDTGRNNLGRVCALFRALRDTGYLDER
jgi:hypothetical protein